MTPEHLGERLPGWGAPEMTAHAPEGAAPAACKGTILLLNGPNLGHLGARLPATYGLVTLAEIEHRVAARMARRGYAVRAFQGEGEGELVRAVHQAADCAGAIVNPGALMVAGWSLRDALEFFPGPWVEVHLTNITAREAFRHESVLSPIARGVIYGFGADGYELAADAVARVLALADTAGRCDASS